MDGLAVPAGVCDDRSPMRVLAVTNIYPTETHPASGTFVEQQVQALRGMGLAVDVLFVDRLRLGMRAYLPLAGLVRSRLRSFGPDIVHCMYGGVMADVTTRAATQWPTVVTFHGSDLLGARSSGPLRRWIAGYGVTCSLKAARRASGIVVVGRRLVDLIPGGVAGPPVRVIPCGIDLARFRPLDRTACRRQLNWPEGRFHVLFNSSGDDPVKRPELARTALDLLNRSGIRAELHELRGLPNGDVPIWLNASDVLLLTSRHEGSPTIVKEALACNVPVVSVEVGDVPERLAGIAGCHLAAPEPEDLAAKLQLVRAGTGRVEGHSRMIEVSAQQTAGQLKRFYDELIAADRIAGRRSVDRNTTECLQQPSS